MIVVRVELWSAINGSKTELARMHICNVGGTQTRRNYSATTFRGRCAAALARLKPQRSAEVNDHPSESVHVWNLVSRALQNMGYGLKDAAIENGGEAA